MSEFDLNYQALADFAAQNVATEEEGGRPGMAMSVDANGLMTVKAHAQDMLPTLEAAQNYKKILQGYADQIQQREAATRAHPIPSLLARLAGNIAAQDKNLPGWVRGAGQTALEMNPLPDQLMQQRIGIAGTLAKAAAEEQATSINMRQLQQGDERIALDRQRLGLEDKRVANAEKATEQAGKKGQQGDLLKLMADTSRDARATLGFDPETFGALATAVGAPPEFVEAAKAHYAEVAANAQKKADALAAAKDAKERATVERAYDKQDRQFKEREKLFDQQTTRMMAIAGVKANVLPKDDIGKVQALNGLEGHLQNLENVLKENARYFGPVAGRWAAINPVRSKEAQRALDTARRTLFRFLATTKTSIAKGSDRDLQRLDELATSTKNTVEQNLQIIEDIRRDNDVDMTNLMQSFPEAGWGGRFKPLVNKRLQPLAESFGPGIQYPKMDMKPEAAAPPAAEPAAITAPGTTRIGLTPEETKQIEAMKDGQVVDIPGVGRLLKRGGKLLQLPPK